MDYTEREPAPRFKLPTMVDGGWYVSGFVDGYYSQTPVIPRGSAGEQYKKGYIEGREAALRDFFVKPRNFIS